MFDDERIITHFVVMEEDVTESRRLHKETAYQAGHDLLTGLIIPSSTFLPAVERYNSATRIDRWW